jgi:hypothetical protein
MSSHNGAATEDHQVRPVAGNCFKHCHFPQLVLFTSTPRRWQNFHSVTREKVTKTRTNSGDGRNVSVCTASASYVVHGPQDEGWSDVAMARSMAGLAEGPCQRFRAFR